MSQRSVYYIKFKLTKKGLVLICPGIIIAESQKDAVEEASKLIEPIAKELVAEYKLYQVVKYNLDFFSMIPLKDNEQSK